MQASQNRVNISKLKALAAKLPANHPFRLTLEVEDTEITLEEYAAKGKSWLRLLDLGAKA